MKLTDKWLINYFGKDEITEQDVLEKQDEDLKISASDESTNISELESLFTTFPNLILKVSILGKNMEDINKYLAVLPQSQIIEINMYIDGNNQIEIDESQLKKFVNLKILEISSYGNSRTIVKNIFVPASVEELYFTKINDVQNINSESDISEKSIIFYSATKKVLESLSPEIASRVSYISINKEDPFWEPSDISLLLKKFPKTTELSGVMYLDESVPDLLVVDEAVHRMKKVDMSPALLSDYKKYVERHSKDLIGKEIFFNSSEVITETFLKDLDAKSNNQRVHYPACILANLQDFSEFNDLNVIYTFCIQNMTDMSLEIAQRLKSSGIKCEILMNSYDNGQNQNVIYSLDQYIQMCQKMNEYIEDIDESLPDKVKFAQIYMRISKNIVYDYTAFYPKTDEDLKYAIENVDTARNLTNGLLYGKCVCAGYADILKNACLLKGIECEYIQGPIDRCVDRATYVAEGSKEDKILHEYDNDTLIVRSYHAWNKIKIDGVWYNFDPTWDHDEIVALRAPKFTFLSDEHMKQMGRPACERSRHPCNITSRSETISTFRGLRQPGDIPFGNELLQQFEASLDEYGNVPGNRKLNRTQKKTNEVSGPPAVIKQSFWKKIVDKLKKFKNMFFNKNIENQSQMNKETYDQLTISRSSDKQQENKNSWSLTNEELQAVKAVERRKIDKKIDDNIKQNEIGEK